MAFTLYLAAPQAMAASDADAAAVQGYMNSIINQPYNDTDLAHKSLARLFGGFIFKPFGGAPASGATVLAKVLGYTNVIAMILGVIIMAYVIVAGALNTAASGEMLGRSWSSVWLPLRTSLAFGMIVPATNGGEVFSVAQSLVIWMIIVGSNSATWLWQQGAQSLLAGDPVMPKVAFHAKGVANPMIDTIFCSTIRSHLIEKKDDKAPSAGFVVNNTDGAITWAPFTLANMDSMSLANAEKIIFEGCGTIALPNSGSVMSGTAYENMQSSKTFTGKSVAWEKAVQDKFNTSLRSNFGAFIASAKVMSEGMYKAGLNGKKIESAKAIGGDQAKDMEVLITGAAADYGTAVLAYENYLTTVQKETTGAAASAGWGDEMTKGGWMRAGAWFFETSRLQGFVQTLLGSLNTPSENASSSSNSCAFSLNYTNCKEQDEEYQSWLSALVTIKGSAPASPGAVKAANSSGSISVTKTVTIKGKAVDTMDEKAIDSMSAKMSSLFMNYVMQLGEDDSRGLAGNVSQSSSSHQSTDVSGLISPFTAMTSLGRGLQQIGVTVWTGGLTVAYLLGINESAGVLSFIATAGQGGGIAGVAKYIMASLAPILAGVGGLAFMLAFAIPFMPVTIWIMLVCGYLVTVIEAIAAAPLAVIMLATPEGEGISGSSFKQALQMINAIVLRPSLSIVGLFAAMTLSYAGFSILNDLFWSVAGLTTDASIFEVLAMIFIYATLAFKLCEYMVSVIHKIPDHIMQWMGGGMAREFGESAAGQDMTGALKSNTAASGVSGVAGVKTAGGIVSDRIKAHQAKSAQSAEADRHSAMLNAMGRGGQS
jgi:conjugal transfer/type IV secretion protein DotA/TraY